MLKPLILLDDGHPQVGVSWTKLFEPKLGAFTHLPLALQTCRLGTSKIKEERPENAETIGNKYHTRMPHRSVSLNSIEFIVVSRVDGTRPPKMSCK